MHLDARHAGRDRRRKMIRHLIDGRRSERSPDEDVLALEDVRGKRGGVERLIIGNRQHSVARFAVESEQLGNLESIGWPAGSGATPEALRPRPKECGIARGDGQCQPAGDRDDGQAERQREPLGRPHAREQRKVERQEDQEHHAEADQVRRPPGPQPE